MYLNGTTRPFDTLRGLTIAHVHYDGGEQVVYFRTECGRHFVMHHQQDCCESVSLIEGHDELRALIGHRIEQAEESSNDTEGARSEWDESFLWTYYRIGTAGGWAVLRWYGSSNGYYSEDVDFEEIEESDVPSRFQESFGDAA